MTDPHFDSRVKNKLEKQDEIEVSDDEDTTTSAVSHGSTSQQQSQQNQQRRRSKKGSSPAPGQLPPNPRIITEKLPKQTSAPSGSSSKLTGENAAAGGVLVADDYGIQGPRKSSVPLAHVHVTESGEFRRSELTTPRHLGSMAFSSMSTEESSSICDADALSRQMGFLSLQGSLQDESLGVGDSPNVSIEDFACTADFLLHIWRHVHKDRQFMLQYEKVLENLLNGDPEQSPYISPVLNSYYRMLLHRLAEVWGFEHAICNTAGQPRISLKVTTESKRPEQLFRDMEDTVPVEPGKALLKRPKKHSLQESGSSQPPRVITTKSFEERKAHYDQVRERIFGPDNNGNEGSVKPHGLDHNHHGEEYGSGHHASGTGGGGYGYYHRSRSELSDTGSDQNNSNYEDMQQQQQQPYFYSPYAGRPVMNTGMGMYGSTPVVYPNGIMFYPGQADNNSTMLDPNNPYPVYMGQQQPAYYHPGYSSPYMTTTAPPPHTMMYHQYAQPVYAQPPYYGQQRTLDRQATQQQQPVFDQHTGQYVFPQPAVDPTSGQLVPTAAFVADAPSHVQYIPYEHLQPQQHQVPMMADPRFGPPLIQQQAQHADYANEISHSFMPQQQRIMGPPQQQQQQQNDGGLIIPLRFPPMMMSGGVAQQSSPLGMFLKIPLQRPSSSQSITGGANLSPGVSSGSPVDFSGNSEQKGSSSSPGGYYHNKPDFAMVPVTASSSSSSTSPCGGGGMQAANNDVMTTDNVMRS